MAFRLLCLDEKLVVGHDAAGYQLMTDQRLGDDEVAGAGISMTI
jgi:hypothetical protein